MAEHTPGPWTYKKQDIGDEVACVVPTEVIGADGFKVVSSEGGLAPDTTWSKELIYANACLIAAAPELLSALKEAHSCATLRDDGTCMGCFVSEVIDKAEGRRVDHA